MPLQSRFYDHPSPPAERDGYRMLADELLARGWEGTVVAHTGGGCMAVSVPLRADGLACLIGCGDDGDDPATARVVLMDAENADGPLGSGHWHCKPGQALDLCVRTLERLRDGRMAFCVDCETAIPLAEGSPMPTEPRCYPCGSKRHFARNA